MEDYNILYQKFIYVKPGFSEIILKAENKAETVKEAGKGAEIVFRNNPKEFKSLERITCSLYPTEKCRFCGKQPVAWQVTWLDGSWGLLCEECGRQLEKIIQEGEKE